MTEPYYSDDHVTLYLARWEDVPPELLAAAVLVTDPPYGVGKADWDDVAPDVSTLAGMASALALMPGVSNLAKCPATIGDLSYRWTLAAHIVNGMTRSAVGFGNWIPVLLYAADDVSVFRQDGDARRFTVGGDMPAHPSPKPLPVMRWVLEMCPDGTILDPYAGSGTTLVAAKSLGRKAIGVECVERYAEVAANRCRQEVLGLSVA